MFSRQTEREQPLFKLDRSNEVTRERSQMHEEEQDYSINGEKLTSLHAKLHQEADKIRKWKNQTEFDIKQKDFKLQESNKTIENLRKSVLDLQLQNESLSTNLQDEVSNREEVLQSISSVKMLCEVLKEHLTKTQSKLADCESEKIEIRYLEKEHQQQFELLSKKFKDVDLEAGKEHERLTNLLNRKIKEYDDLHEEMKQKSITSKTEFNQILEKLDEKDIEIRDISKEVQKYEEKVHDFQKTIESLKKDLTLSEKRLNETDMKHDKLITEQEDLQKEKDALQNEVKDRQENVETLLSEKTDLKKEIDLLNDQHSREVLILQANLDNCKNQIDNKDKKLRFLETDLERITSEIQQEKCSKDIIIMEKADLTVNVGELEKQRTELMAQLEQNSFSMNQMTLNINELQHQLENKQKEGAALMLQFNELQAQLDSSQMEKFELAERVRQLENEVSVKQVNLNDLQKQLDKEIQLFVEKQKESEQNFINERLKAEASFKELEDTVSALSASKGESHTQSKMLTKLKKDLESLGKKNKVLQEEVQASNTLQVELREKIEDIQSELDTERENNQNIQDEKQAHEEAVAGELLYKEKAASDLEVKNKNLKTDLTSKNKQIKELEKEVKQMRSKMTLLNKNLAGKTEELQANTTDLFSLQEELKRKTDECDKEREKMEEMQEVTEKCMKEKEEMFKKCEEQRIQMSSIMQNYKIDNEKEVSTKKREIESLKSQMKSKVDELKNEIDKLSRCVNESGSQMVNLQKVYGEKETLVSKLEQENSKKNEELKELQKQLGNMFIKNTTTTDVQTSPYSSIKRQSSTPRTVPKTPQLNGRMEILGQRTPVLPKTPVTVSTPCNKTPQRSILKSISSSANKKRRVVFASKDEDEIDLLSEDSDSFEVLTTADKIIKGTPLILKSPRSQVLNIGRSEVKTKQAENGAISSVPLSRTPRGPAVDLEKIKNKKSKQKDKENLNMEEDTINIFTDAPQKTKDKSSVRTAPQKNGGRFFKNSPKNRKTNPQNKQASWFENDDIFGFAMED